MCKARKVMEDIDWDCEVHRNFASENYSIKRRFVTGLKWLFETGPKRSSSKATAYRARIYFASMRRCWKDTGTTNGSGT